MAKIPPVIPGQAVFLERGDDAHCTTALFKCQSETSGLASF